MSVADEWPEPEPLPELRPVPALPPALLPEALRAWVADVAERMQVPIEYPATGALVSLSSLVGRRVALRPRRHDDWAVVPNLWGLVIGPPGAKKTPALDEVFRPLRRLEAEAHEKHLADSKGPTDREIVEAQRRALKAKISDAVKTEEEDPRKYQDEFDKLCIEPPPPRRYLVADSTVERLAVLLQQNPIGLLLFRDELTGWLRSFDRKGHEGDRAFYLEAWGGDGAYVVDRIGRGTVRIPGMCLSLLGTIQPGPLAHYLRDALRSGAGADGLLQRMQVAVWPDPPATWRHIDQWPDKEARARAYELFRRLDAIEPIEIGAEMPEEGLPFLRYDLDAQEIADAYSAELARRVRAAGEHPAIVSHLAKYESLLPSLSLIFHLCNVIDAGDGGNISPEATRMAVDWCVLLEAHARRIYGSTGAADVPGRLLARRLHELNSPFTAREVYKDHGWTGLQDREQVEAEADALVRLGWLKATPIRSLGGRKIYRYEINPRNPRKGVRHG